MSALKYWLAFNRVPGIGPKRFELIEAHFGDMETAWHAGIADLIQAGLEPMLAEAVSLARRTIDPDAEVERADCFGLHVVTRPDALYPKLLKEIYDPPPVLYVRGSLEVLDDTGLAIVGPRNPTPYGREVALRLATELSAAGLVVVSGLARGIDGIAHRAALESGGTTVAVLAHGADRIYPPEHRRMADEIAERGALVTEFAPGCPVEPGNFPRRNRILSGLTRGTLVVEAGFKSGAMITAGYAIDQDRDVFAVPGSILSERSAGTNHLIQDGACAVTRSADILEKLGVPARATQTALIPQGGPDDGIEARVLGGVTDEPVHIDEVIRHTGLPSETVSAALAMMELRGLVRPAGPLHYSKPAGLAVRRSKSGRKDRWQKTS